MYAQYNLAIFLIQSYFLKDTIISWCSVEIHMLSYTDVKILFY